MAHGHQDWGQGQSIVTVHSVSDLGELAARVGDTMSMYRSGNVIFHDNFDEGLGAWTVGTPGAGSLADCRIDWVFQGAAACRLFGNGDQADGAYITKFVTMPFLSKGGLETMLSFENMVSTMYVHMIFKNSSYGRQARIKLDTSTSRAYYLNSAGAYVELEGNPGLGLVTKPFHTLKFTADFANNRWGKIILDGIFYDLSDQALRANLAGSPQGIEIYFLFISDGLGDHMAWIDNVIVTMNEP